MAGNDVTLFLPDEIISNILKRLPAKSLVRFQCVCKQWNTLIKTPSFIQHHLHHSTHQNSSLLIITKPIVGCSSPLLLFNSESQFREIDNDVCMCYFCVVGSINGLLCLENLLTVVPTLLLWNPATRDVKQVHVSRNDFSPVHPDWDFTWFFGFGFSPIINDYKIVSILYMGSDICEVKVYSLNTGCWRKISFDSITGIFVSRDSVTVNGVIFWCGSKYTMDRHESFVIVSFDLITEVFTVIPYPVAFANCLENLAVYDNKLAIISGHTIKSYGNFSVYFWVMEEGAIDSSGGRWISSEEYVIGDPDYYTLFPCTIWRNQLVAIEEDTKHLYLIDVMANESKKFDIPISISGDCINYVESLVPLTVNFQIQEY